MPNRLKNLGGFPGGTNAENAHPGLRWLLRLRWAALAGQASTCAFASQLDGIHLPWLPLSGFLGFTLLSNMFLHHRSRREGIHAGSWISGLLGIDTLVLTGMLWFTGGTTNPFTLFFLLHLAMAAVLVPRSHMWFFLLLVVAGALVQTTSPPWPIAPRLERIGNLAALALVGTSIAYFVANLRHALESQERDLGEWRHRALRDRQFASLATLAAGVAHELASPLGTIAVASADLASLPADTPSDQWRDDALLIRSEVDRCRRILDRLGSHTTSGIGDGPVRTSLSQILAALSEALHPSLSARLVPPRLERDVQMVLPEAPLIQSLVTLVKNAVEASPEGRVVDMSFRREANDSVFTVRDRGEGIPPDLLPRLGEPFLSTKGPGKGMGLGLFLVRTFADRCGGTLKVTSRPGEGTTAELRVPDAEMGS
ncbi:MAG: HAMP domain-containing histidine kinase [Fibrobacteria bacterium]|nr:HAMP domain-containing histidine kinase [Fibrobacteria bacterium]